MKAKDLTFKTFLRIVEQDLGGDIAKLQADLSMIDTEMAKRTQPLLQKKVQLQKQLAVKQKQQQADLKRNGGDPDQQMDANQQTGSRATTPGSSGASTPGQQ